MAGPGSPSLGTARAPGMPDLNIQPHLPTRKGVLELTSELEGPGCSVQCTHSSERDKPCPRSQGRGRAGTGPKSGDPRRGRLLSWPSLFLSFLC